MSNYVLSKKKPQAGDRGFIIGNRFIPIQNGNTDVLNLNKLSFVPNWFFDFEEDNPLLTNVNNVPFEEGYFSSKAPRYNWSVRYLRSDINLNNWTELCMCCFIRVLGNRNSYQYLIDINGRVGTVV